MQKIITILFSFILVCSLTACSESPETLYGYYKEINEERDKWGYIHTIIIQENKIKFGFGGMTYPITTPYKKGDSWVADSSVNKNHKFQFKIINDTTIEYFDVDFDTPKSLGKYIKITKEEYEHILNNPKMNRLPEPPLF